MSVSLMDKWLAEVVESVVDGRKDRPTAVVLCALTSDGHYQELGVASAEQARAIVDVLTRAWPEVRS